MTKPSSVAIVGMGMSHTDYLLTSLVDGKPTDEVWGINAIGGIIRCDKVFMMDRVDTLWHLPRFFFTKDSDTPIHTSVLVDGVPNLVEYPRDEIVKKFNSEYFSNTVPYAIAYALYTGVTELHLYGVDYTYTDNDAAEHGRGCTEFWLGIAFAMGTKITISSNSTLLGTAEKKFYGYEEVCP